MLRIVFVLQLLGIFVFASLASNSNASSLLSGDILVADAGALLVADAIGSVIRVDP